MRRNKRRRQLACRSGVAVITIWRCAPDPLSPYKSKSGRFLGRLVAVTGAVLGNPLMAHRAEIDVL
jgi:hypothetical protein